MDFVRAGARTGALVALLTCSTGVAAAQVGSLREKRIAVLEFEAPWRARCDKLLMAGKTAKLERENRCKALAVLSDAVRTAATDLTSRAGMTLYTRANTLEFLRENKICVAEDGDCAVETGRMMGVHFLLVGKVSELEGTYIVDLQLYDVKTGAVLPGASQVEGKGLLDAARLVRTLAPKVLGRGLGILSEVERRAAATDIGGVPATGVSGGLAVNTSPPGATCQVDGNPVGEAPCRVEALPAGRHLLQLTRDTCEPYQEVVTVEPGLVTHREITLAYVPVPTTFDVEPRDAAVQLDGRSADVSAAVPLVPGPHRVASSRFGYAPEEQSFEVRPGQPGSVSVRLAVLPIPTTVQVRPADAEVEVNGQRALAGRPLEILPGSHRVVVRRAGHVPQERRVELEAGQKPVVVEIALLANPTLSVETTPRGAALRLDGRDRGRTDTSVVLEPGTHAVELELAGFENELRTLPLRAGHDERLRIALTRGLSKPERAVRATRRAWARTLTVTAAAGLAVFAWQGLHARSLDAKAGDLQAGTSGAKANAKSERTAMMFADAGLGVAILAALPAGYLWWRHEF